MKVYISGKITGLQHDYSRNMFEEAERSLKHYGYTPVNPFNNGLGYTASWEEHMKKDIEMLSDCDAIYMLENWESSTGANIEKNIAEEIGMKVLFENEFDLKDFK